MTFSRNSRIDHGDLFAPKRRAGPVDPGTPGGDLEYPGGVPWRPCPSLPIGAFPLPPGIDRRTSSLASDCNLPAMSNAPHPPPTAWIIYGMTDAGGATGERTLKGSPAIPDPENSGNYACGRARLARAQPQPQPQLDWLVKPLHKQPVPYTRDSLKIPYVAALTPLIISGIQNFIICIASYTCILILIILTLLNWWIWLESASGEMERRWLNLF